MNISQTFIERPIATSLLMVAIALFGGVAYRSLAVSDLPNVDFPTLLVTATLPGSSPENMASAVATPLENQFSAIAGLNSMTSSNSLGNTQITLEFDLARKVDGAAVDVQAAITQASRLLPQGMPTPPTFTKVNPADQPILYIALTSPTLPLWTLDEYRPVVVAYRNGSPVRLDELGTLLDSVEDDKTASWFYQDKFKSRAIVLARSEEH